ncbi:hypothetical protein [Ammonifex thiophilus]|uniref:hypothetical protein n=1 Tax=Ammonifex thiophilus TaxID=444093 RepID=UPI00106A5E4A|nr:hypothetical protein [Ammonifex thiophilus]
MEWWAIKGFLSVFGFAAFAALKASLMVRAARALDRRGAGLPRRALAWAALALCGAGLAFDLACALLFAAAVGLALLARLALSMGVR